MGKAMGLMAALAAAAVASGCRGRAEASGGDAAPVAQAAAGQGAATGGAQPGAASAPAPATSATQPLAIPASWQELPEAGHVVEQALEKANLRGAKVAAWGDPARGCYAIRVAAREEGAKLAQVEAGLRKGFGAPPAQPSAAGGAAASDASGAGSSASTEGSVGSAVPSAANAGSAELQLTLPPPHTGAVRARLRDDGAATRLTAAVCFFHARYPEQCRAHCERALASLEAP